MTFTPFFGEMMILGLLFIICARVFFIRKTRIDSIVVFSPITFIFLALQILAWNLGYAEIILTILVCIVVFINHRAFLRFCNHLFVDSYSLLFFITSFILLVLITLSGILFFRFRPVQLDAKKYKVLKQVEYFSGDFSEGFSKSDNLNAKKNLKLITYSPDKKASGKDSDAVILFVPDKRADLFDYDSYLTLLAKEGFTVYAGEFGFSTVQQKKFSVDFIRKKYLINLSLKDKVKYAAVTKEFPDTYAHEFETLCKIADEREAKVKKFFVCADGTVTGGFPRLQNTARFIYGGISLNSIPEYKTSGFGFIEQSDPLFAKIKFNLNREQFAFTASYCVLKTKNAVQEFLSAIKDSEKKPA